MYNLHNKNLYMNILISILLAPAFLILAACHQEPGPDELTNRQPAIFPDYAGVTIPASIAPLNFKILEDCDAVYAKIEGSGKKALSLSGRDQIQIPQKEWTELLTTNAGQSIAITVSVRKNGRRLRYAPFQIFVSNDPIDYGIVYRLIAPGYEVYSKMGIYQRNLSGYRQKPIIENTLVPGSCVNCHSFRLTDPSFLNIHVRGPKGGTILKVNDQVSLLNTKTQKTISNFVYPFWHPSGQFIAYSVNNIKQVFHESKEERIEVVDLKSDVVVYDIAENQTLLCDRIMSDQVFETYPVFSPDGRSLYFCASPAVAFPSGYRDVRYNLCRIAFDPENKTFGEKIDTLFNASALKKSATFPRPSPDGRYIMFTMTDYGNFPIWHKEADLYLLDLQNGRCEPIKGANSDNTESYHSWSSNSRWFVFSSRRIDGLYTHPFIAHLDKNGKAGKPFLLPQEDPDAYDALLFSYNIPEFVNQPVGLDLNETEGLLHSEGKKVEQRE